MNKIAFKKNRRRKSTDLKKAHGRTGFKNVYSGGFIYLFLKRLLVKSNWFKDVKV